MSKPFSVNPPVEYYRPYRRRRRCGCASSKSIWGRYVGCFLGRIDLYYSVLLSEIIPKSLGANHWRRLAPSVSVAVMWMKRVTRPLIWMSQQVTRLMGKGDEGHYIRQEMSAMAKIGHESGELDEQESKFLQMLKVRDMPLRQSRRRAL